MDLSTTILSISNSIIHWLSVCIFPLEDITGGLTSPSLTSTSEVEPILVSPQYQIGYHNEGPLPGHISHKNMSWKWQLTNKRIILFLDMMIHLQQNTPLYYCYSYNSLFISYSMYQWHIYWFIVLYFQFEGLKDNNI